MGRGRREVISKALALWQRLSLVSSGVILLLMLPFLSLGFPLVMGDQGPGAFPTPLYRLMLLFNNTGPTGRSISVAMQGGRPLKPETGSPCFEPPASR